MKKIFLLRHGDYQNPGHVLPVRLPGFPLSASGKEQILKVADLLQEENIKAIYSSPILRTRQSAGILSQKLGVPVHISRSLIEVDSPLQGQRETIIPELERYGDTFKYPGHIDAGGKTPEHIYARMKKIIYKTMSQHEGACIYVSHGDPIMIFYLFEQGKSIQGQKNIHSYGPYIPKGGIIGMEYDGGRLKRAKRINF